MHKLFVTLALLRGTIAASSSTIATPPAVPSPTNTYCPLSWPTPIAEPGHICREDGYVSEPLNALSHSCYNNDPRSCYRACVKDPDCRSFAEDRTRNLCINYGKSLADMNFTSSPNNRILHSDLSGCYACNSTLVQKTSFCPNNLTRIDPPLKGYTCGVGGTFADDQITIRHAGATFEECYGYCARLDQYDGCSSFSWDTQGINGRPRCHLFLRSLYQKGFKAVNGAPPAWSLRGCFECNDPKPPIDPCVPPTFPLTPQFKNGNFSETVYNRLFHKLEPKDWVVDTNNTRAVTGPDGNTYVRMFADGSHGKRGDYAIISQTLYGFNRNATSPGRFYNFSYDIALVQYNVPSPGGYYCSLSVGYIGGTSMKLNNASFPNHFTTVGPYLVDASVYPMYDLRSEFMLMCRPTTLGRPGGNVTILIDNVRWSQNGREIGSV